MEYRKATLSDLEKIWDKNIKENPEDNRWVKWKERYINDNLNNKCVTFVVLDNDNPVGEITILFSSKCESIKDDLLLCNDKDTANMNAFRIQKEYENQGHISKLVKMAEAYAKEKGIKYLTIGAEAKESRNLGIYLHWGYNEFVKHQIYKEEDNALVLYYRKKI